MPRAVHDPDQFFALTIEISKDPVLLIEHWPDRARKRVQLYSHKGGQLFISTNSLGDKATSMGIPDKMLVWLDSYRGPLWAWRDGKKGDVSISYLF